MRGTGYSDRLLNQKPGWQRHDDNGNGGQKNKEEEEAGVEMTM